MIHAQTGVYAWDLGNTEYVRSNVRMEYRIPDQDQLFAHVPITMKIPALNMRFVLQAICVRMQYWESRAMTGQGCHVLIHI
jgi:hypothetical protein